MSNSEIILPAQSHAGDSSLQTVTGTAFKGDGYYSRADGLHTVQYTVTGFIGSIKIQGTLATTPTEQDWFSIPTTQLTSTDQNSGYYSGSFLYNFTGNYVYVRALVQFNDGTVNSITLNH